MSTTVSGFKPHTRLDGIYAIRHIPTGRAYVGQAQNLKARTMAHLQALKRNNHPQPGIQEVFNREGEHAFDVIILEYTYSHTCTSTRAEQFWISFLSRSFGVFNGAAETHKALARMEKVEQEDMLRRARQAELKIVEWRVEA